jgi:hypothetical protein
VHSFGSLNQIIQQRKETIAGPGVPPEETSGMTKEKRQMGSPFQQTVDPLSIGCFL